MTAEEAVERLSERLGVPNWDQDKRGRRRLVFDGTVEVSFDAGRSPGTLWLSAPLRRVPEKKRSSFLEEILKGNAQGAAEAGPVMALEEDDVVLQEMLVVEELDTDGLLEALERFVNRAEAWKNHLNDAAEKPLDIVDPWAVGWPGGVIRP